MIDFFTAHSEQLIARFEALHKFHRVIVYPKLISALKMIFLNMLRGKNLIFSDVADAIYVFNFNFWHIRAWLRGEKEWKISPI
jgi:hypothetical protein